MGPTLFYNTRRVQLATMAALHSIPTAFAVREFVDAGGLMSYGTSLADMYRQVGVYTGRILRGAKPADFPSTAGQFRAGDQLADCPDAPSRLAAFLLARADEVIE